MENLNQEKGNLVCFYLGDRQKHLLWRKKIIHVVNRKERKFVNFAEGAYRRSQHQIRDTTLANTRNISFLREESVVRDTNLRATNLRMTQGRLIRETEGRLTESNLAKPPNLPSQSSYSAKEEDEAEGSSSSLKVNLCFFMNRLSINLLDEDDK